MRIHQNGSSTAWHLDVAVTWQGLIALAAYVIILYVTYERGISGV